MRRFSGVGGSLYALGERLTFTDQPLLDCGDGWDWRAPDELSYWLEEPEVSVVRNGERIGTGVVESFLPTGRIGLPCNMSHGYVLASGVCIPISWAADGDRWEVTVDSVTSNVTSLGADAVQTKTKVVGTTGVLENASVPITNVLARFPSGSGVFTGIGTAVQVGSDVHITFREGVSYDPR